MVYKFSSSEKAKLGTQTAQRGAPFLGIVSHVDLRMFQVPAPALPPCPVDDRIEREKRYPRHLAGASKVQDRLHLNGYLVLFFTWIPISISSPANGLVYPMVD